MLKDDSDARRQILKSAEKKFAERGFAGTSVQDIIAGTRFTKPTLYYYFKSKEGLFKALLEDSCDECFEATQRAASRFDTLEDKLVAIAAELFEHVRQRKDATRLAFAAAFAPPKEMPDSLRHDAKRCRNFDFLHQLIKQGLANGELDSSFTSRELTSGIYGALSFHLMANLLSPETKLNRQSARRVVQLFLKGARAK
ncbi:MAG: TetR/AcrR family transcriptional regulator [Verrucomicrobiota bacterium]